MITPVKARDPRVLLPWPGLLAGMLALAMVLSWLLSRSPQRTQLMIGDLGGTLVEAAQDVPWLAFDAPGDLCNKVRSWRATRGSR